MFWYNGELIAAESLFALDSPVDMASLDAGLKFGASVFSTLRGYAGRLEHPMTQWQAHCDRIQNSLTYFHWQSPDWHAVQQGAQQMKNHYPVLRLTCFPDGKVWISGRDLPPLLSQQQKEGVACWLAPPEYARSLPAHKTGNYLSCWLARQQAQQQGGQEAILTNAAGYWLETATGNLWGWADGQWWTPISHKIENQCLPGIMRSQWIDLLSRSGAKVETCLWNSSVVNRFEAIAYSNCVVQLLPIHTIFNTHTTLEYDSHHASLKALQQLVISYTESNDPS